MEPIRQGLKVWLEGRDITTSSTTWKDNSGNNNNFVITGSPKSDNGFANLDGTWYASTSSLNYNYGTIEFTINFPEATNSMTFGSWESSNWKYSFGNYIIQIRSKKNPSVGVGNLNETSFSTAYGKTATYGLTYNESSYTIFANGKIIKAGNSSDIPNITSFYLGLKADLGERGKAKVKSFRIYNRMLTHTEILNNYNYELLDMQKQSFVNESNLPKIVGKLTDSSNIKIAGNKYGNKVDTVVNKIVEKADNVTKAINQEVINTAGSFKVGVGNNVNVSTDVQDGFGEVGLKGVTYNDVYPILKNSNYFSKGGNVVLDEDIIKITANGSYQNFFLKKEAINVKPNTNYTLVVEIIKNTIESTTDRIISMLHTSTNADQITYFKTGVSIYKTNNGVHKFLATTRENFNEVSLGTRCFLGMECTSGEIWFKVSLLEGDHRTTSNLPLQLEGITGVGDKSKNLFTGYVQGSIDLNDTGGDVNATGVYRSHYLEVKANTRYTISSQKSICYYDINKARITNNYSDNFITQSNCRYIRFQSGVKDEVFMCEGANIIREPYWKGHKIEIISSGKNLFNFNDSDKIIKILPESLNVSSANSCSVLQQVGRSCIIMRYPTKIGKKYTFSANIKCSGKLNSPVRLNDLEKDSTEIDWQLNKGQLNTIGFSQTTFVSDKSFINVVIYCSSSQDLFSVTDIQLEENSSSTKFEAYIEDKTQILLDEPLMRLPNGIYDEITKDRKLIRRIGKVVLNGTEDGYRGYGNQPTQSTTIAFSLPIDNFNGNWSSGSDIISNSFPCIDGNTFYSLDIEGIRSDSNQNGRLLFRILKNKLQTQDIEGFKQWLSQNPTTVYYELATPIITDIDTSSLRIFKDGNISFNTLVPPESSHMVQINKSAQIEESIKQVQSIDKDVSVLEGSYNNMILDISQQLDILEVDYKLSIESEEI